MTPLIIVLIVIGIIFIIISCFFMKSDKEVRLDNTIMEEALMQSSLVKKKVEDTLSEVTDETIIKTEDELSKISNEKIIAVNDFSNMVLDKINNNHDEVVFLYNMLNEKESEIKDLMKQVSNLQDDTIIQKNHNANNSSQKMLIEESQLTTEKNHMTEEQVLVENEVEYCAMEKQVHSLDQKELMNSISSDLDIRLKFDKKMDDTTKRPQSQNRNDMILQMYDEGKSIVQIAKELGLGQGEVKLIIDLYKY